MIILLLCRSTINVQQLQLQAFSPSTLRQFSSAHPEPVEGLPRQNPLPILPQPLYTQVA
jgi:hypothetical protein